MGGQVVDREEHGGEHVVERGEETPEEVLFQVDGGQLVDEGVRGREAGDAGTHRPRPPSPGAGARS